jgi:uncharacterized protein
VGDPEASDTVALINEVIRTRWRPNLVLAVASPKDVDAAETVALLASRSAVDGAPTAYLCQRFVCRLPVTSPEELATQLRSQDAAPAG